MSEGEATRTTSVRHPLFISRGGFVLRLRDQGILAGPDGLTVRQDGHDVTYPYGDIAAINLMMSVVPKSGSVAQMTIRFRNGDGLRVLNTNAWGSPDPDQTQHYYRFKTDLHQRLVESGAAGAIEFTSGHSARRAQIVQVTMAIAAAFFVGGPIVIYAMTGEAQALLLCLFGVAFVVPFMRAARRNAPAQYDPRTPPDMLA